MLRLNEQYGPTRRTTFDIITIGGILVGVLALLALVYFYVVPIKLADIKVPVATDKASYYAGQPIKGIFFGDIFYKGEVRILREVFCANNYHRVIQPPAESAVGEFFSTQSRAHKLEGVTVPIGSLPDDVPLGANCVLQFTNVYDIKTPFGTRHEEYQYYTQNFSIITKERRLELDTGTKPTAEPTSSANTSGGDASSYTPPVTSQSPTTPTTPAPNVTNNTTNNTTTNNNTTNTPPAEAPAVSEVCTIDALGIRLFCRDR